LTSNNFNGNKASNGGAIYLVEDKKSSELNKVFNRSIYLENNHFRNNIADNFGGAVYSHYDRNQLQFTAKDNELIYNEAGIMGGGLYSLEAINKNVSLEGLKFENNTVNSINDNYSTKPSYIKLNMLQNQNNFRITTGKYFPLNFSLHDEYDNIVVDNSNYYFSITIKVELIEKDKKKSHKNNEINKVNDSNEIKEENAEDTKKEVIKKYIVEGNSASFINGKYMNNNNNNIKFII